MKNWRAKGKNLFVKELQKFKLSVNRIHLITIKSKEFRRNV